ncbi:(d)CMP kinase [Desulfogranum mediterraneum]|uniref:(d)CMP kinase n=1 Tax=Desulfogranum mediterraneum TaxID=160661 RepID=UPI0003F6EF19|nr:(d)CMP kinase [Desulfogranum mediterraneum]
MSERIQVVTIDGPSGGGKSTVSRELARKLGFTYLDTGAMYRAVAYGCLEAELPAEESPALDELLSDLEIVLQPGTGPDDDVQVFLNQREIGRLIRTPEMGMQASAYSALPMVRNFLTELQQQMGAAGGLVAEGRDTGTVVFPEAAWKFYLDARAEIRMVRRAAQLRSQGVEVDEDQLLAQIIKRDKDDSQRRVAPLKQAEDAVYIDASTISAGEVVARMYRQIVKGGK